MTTVIQFSCGIICIILVCVFQLARCEDDENIAAVKLYNELREQCLYRLNISSLHEQNITNLACMDRCILEKVGIITRDGVFHTENIPANIRDVAIICDQETKRLEPCQRAQSYNLCVFKKVGIRVLSEVCANETEVVLDYALMPQESMMNLTDDTLTCYNRCMLIKMEKIDAQNRINANLLKIYADDDDKVTQIVRTCEEEHVEDDVCLQAVQRELCIMESLNYKH